MVLGGGLATAPLGPLVAASTPVNTEVVPCPTCWLLADLVAPLVGSAMKRSRCARGHENTLAPTVLIYLLAMLGPAFTEETPIV